MATKEVRTPDRTVLRELEDSLDEQRGALLQLPLQKEDVGGELVAVLSEGLYTNPLHSIREYVQNSVDANAKNVIIKVTGNSVAISDDGDGMNLQDLLAARRFGISPKSLGEHVGFRGIGIYSGFAICRRLRIQSTKRGSEHAHTLVFEFQDMKSQLDAERKQPPSGPKTPLVELLSKHTKIKREAEPVQEGSHYTTVILQDISEPYVEILRDRAKLRRYLLENVPIDFAPSFRHGPAINEELRKQFGSYNAVQITLQHDGQTDDVVNKYRDIDVQAPTFGHAYNASGKHVAFYWACLNKTRSAIERGQQDKEYEGFVYKLKGFTVGDRAKLERLFPRRVLYPWYTGEVYVLDRDVIPNAERDDFETNRAKDELEAGLAREFTNLSDDAETFQAEGVAERRIGEARTELQQIEQQLEGAGDGSASPALDSYERYARLHEIAKTLRQQKKAASEGLRPEVDELLKKITRLKSQAKSEAEHPRPAIERQRKASKKGSPASLAPPQAVPVQTLTTLLREAGWAVEGEAGELAAVVQAALEDALGLGTPQYVKFLEAVQGKLAEVGK